MNSLERSWRLRLIPAGFLAAIGAGFGMWYIVALLPRDVGSGAAGLADILVAILILFVLFGVAAREIVKAIFARQLAQTLKGTAKGRDVGLPVLDFPLDGETRQVNGRPNIMFAAKPWQVCVRFGVAIAAVIAAVGAVAYCGLWLAYYSLALVHSHEPNWLVAFVQWSQSPEPRQSSHRPLYVPLFSSLAPRLAVFSALSVAAVVALYHALKAVAKEQWSIETDEIGITTRYVWGGRRLMTWYEARVLFLSEHRLPNKPTNNVVVPPTRYVITLLDHDASLTWAPIGAARPAKLEEYTALAGLIIAHTQLRPYLRDQIALDRILRWSLAWLAVGALALMAVVDLLLYVVG